MTIERACPRCAYLTTRPIERCPICDIPLPKRVRAWTDTRRAVRVPLPSGTEGELDGQMPVKVLDLSLLGACLEHAEPLLPRHQCLLTFLAAEAEPLRLPGSIVWSRAHLFAPESGQTKWMYRSGVEFQEMPATVARDLDAFLHRLVGGARSLPGVVALSAD